MARGLLLPPIEAERLLTFARAELPALQARPVKSIAARIRIRKGQRPLVAYAGKDGSGRQEWAASP